MSDISSLIKSYSEGVESLRHAVRDVPDSGWDAVPIEGKWSIRQVVCHLTDADIVYADRMKRVIAEDNPTLFDADPEVFGPALHCAKRCPQNELEVMRSIRGHIVPILESCDIEDFQRTGVHSTDGPMTLETLLERITTHIPHHIQFIEQKLQAMGG